MSPLIVCQKTKPHITAVSDLKTLGPKLMGIINFFDFKKIISFKEKPPSGPIKIAPEG